MDPGNRHQRTCIRPPIVSTTIASSLACANTVFLLNDFTHRVSLSNAIKPVPVLDFPGIALGQLWFLGLVAGRHKALVFSQFTDFLKLLAERLDGVGITHQYLDGSTPAAERGKHSRSQRLSE